MIAIIDYDIGNINSVFNMCQRLGIKSKIAKSPDDLIQVDRIILPGNGAFDSCVTNLRKSGLLSVLEEKVIQNGTPLMGICVGAQMLGHGSAEGHESGLGWLDMRVERFPALPEFRVPHMGWNKVSPAQVEHPLVKEMDAETRFYFVHSYYMKPKNSDDVLLRASYGNEFAAGVARNNIVGVQFHPEKSHRFGKKILNAFARWEP